MMLLFQAAIALMKLIYGLLKIFPTRRKIVFLSRQVNKPSIDYELLAQEIKERDPGIKVVMLCKRLEKNPKELLQFTWIFLRSLYHLATSKVCILDTYWPAVSLLDHKPALKVVQIWHAMGKIKQSGHKTLNREGGRGKKMADALKMHEKYDLIIAGAAAWNPYYCDSFNCQENILYNVGLPRIDYLIHRRFETSRKIYDRYPELKDKPVIVYAPTFRRTGNKGWELLLQEIDFEKYHLIIRPHPNQKLAYDQPDIYELKEFSTLDVLTVADFLITDYSAIAVEAAAIDLKTFYYLYDYQVYSSKNGLNIDLFKEMPGAAFEEAAPLMRALESGIYPLDCLQAYKEKFLPQPLGEATVLIVDRIMSYMEAKN